MALRPTPSSLLPHLVGTQGTSLPPAPLHPFHTFPGSTWMVKACPGSARWELRPAVVFAPPKRCRFSFLTCFCYQKVVNLPSRPALRVTLGRVLEGAGAALGTLTPLSPCYKMRLYLCYAESFKSPSSISIIIMPTREWRSA